MTQAESPNSEPNPHIEFIQEGQLTLSELEDILDILADHLLSQMSDAKDREPLMKGKTSA